MSVDSDNDSEQNGTQHNSLGDAFVDVDPFCWDIINHNPLSSALQKTDNPVYDIRINFKRF